MIENDEEKKYVLIFFLY